MADCPRTPRGGRVAPAVFLRVYEPLDALVKTPAPRRHGARARGAFADRASDERGPVLGSAVVADPAELAARERAAALRAASALPPRVVHDVDLVRDGLGRAGSPAALLLSPADPDGVPRLCPADLGWRALLALEELRLAVQPAVLRSFMSPAAMADAARRLGETFRQGAAPHVRTCAWQVPLAWLAAFRPGQRLLAAPDEYDVSPPASAPSLAARDCEPGRERDSARERDAARDPTGQEGVPRMLRYRTPMADARRWVARALAAARRAGLDLLPENELEELGRWLEEFHARSVVELDLTGLAGLLPAAEFADRAGRPSEPDAAAAGADELSSVALVAAAVDELRQQSPDSALERLTVVRDRWIVIRAYERAS